MCPITFRNEKGDPFYSSSVISPIDYQSESHRKRDQDLDELIRLNIRECLSNSRKLSTKKKVLLYWIIGSTIRKIYETSDLVLKGDLLPFLQNVSLVFKEFNLPKDNPKKNRNIPLQFYTLSSFDKDQATKITWTNWSTIFDSPIFQKRSDLYDWLNEVISSDRFPIENQEFFRLWAQSFKVLFGDIEPDRWTYEEFTIPLESVMTVISRLISEGIKIKSSESKEQFKNVLIQNAHLFRKLKRQEISQDQYIDALLTCSRESMNSN